MHPLVRGVGGVVNGALSTGRMVAERASVAFVGWHDVTPGARFLATPFDDFRRHLDVIAATGRPVLAFDDAIDRLRDGRLAGPAVVLTFDDGYAGVAELAWPELVARGWPATLYVCPGKLAPGSTFPWDAEPARLLTASEVVDVAAQGLDIGSHTMTHRWLPSLPRHEVDAELRDSKAALDALLGRPVTGLAYPMGGWTPAVARAAEAAGYRYAVTVDRGRERRADRPYAVRRAFAPDGARDFERVLAGAYTFLRPLDRHRTRNGPLTQLPHAP
jgi:peptidoglycan/xylan/chitin deacetylase (PgdA/CDA1 family)